MYPEARMIKAMRVWQLPDNKTHELSKHCNSGDYFAQEKIDGFWYQFEKTENNFYLFSRTVSAKNGLLVEKGASVPHIVEFLEDKVPPQTTLIGEIFYPNGTSKDVTTVMGCDVPKALERQKDAPLHYYIHDIIQYDGVDLQTAGAELRYKILAKIWDLHNLGDNDTLHLAKCVTENIEDFISDVFAAGGEGVVLKKKDAIYYPDKKPAWTGIKVKKHGEADVICMGFCDATKYYDGKLDLIANYGGKDAAQWPYWIVEEMELATGKILSEQKVPVGETMTIIEHEREGISFRTVPVTKGYYNGWKTSLEIGAYDEQGNLKKIGTVSSGLTDEIKESISKYPNLHTNMVLEVGYMEKDVEEKTLRHPTFVRWREDKNNSECTLKEIFN